MPQTNNIITPKERLMIAAHHHAAMVTAMSMGQTVVGDINKAALRMADKLITESGCIVEGQPELMHEMD